MAELFISRHLVYKRSKTYVMCQNYTYFQQLHSIKISLHYECTENALSTNNINIVRIASILEKTVCNFLNLLYFQQKLPSVFIS